jgi:SPP1 gp7 family putative phage head morphogenesis protein
MAGENDQPTYQDRAKNGGGKATPISQSLIARAVRGMLTTVVGVMPSTWFSPVQPIQPVAQQAEGRQWDYPVGYNLRLVPKEQEGVTFPQLRQLADGYDVLRLIIEHRKDQMVQLKWNFRPIDPKTQVDDDPRIDELQNFFRVPDGRTPWQVWLRMLLEDMLVVDNACVYPRYDNGETAPPSKMELVCGDTIKPVIDATGRIPLPPSVAYQQILKGVPAVDYSADQLVYVPRNRRTNKVYGYGYVEQIIMTVNIALRRQLSQLQYFTEGSVPNLLITAPKEWQPDQIKKFDKWFQEKLAGDTGARRQATFIPDGAKPFDTKEAILKDEFDEWLVRVVCFAFSVAPTPFIKQMNRATAQTAKESATQEGLFPMMQWVKDLMDLLVWKYWGYTDLEFGWDEDEAVDPLVQSQIDDVCIRNGSKSIDEVRLSRGDDPVGMPAMLVLPTGPVLLSTLIFQAKDDPTGEKAAQQEQEQQQAQLEAKAQAQAQGGSNGGSNDGMGGAGGGSSSAGGPAAEAGKYLGSALTKAVKRGGFKPIDRDRGTVKKLRDGMASDLAKVLKAAGQKAADSVRSVSMTKADQQSQPKTVDEILAEIDTGGVSVVSDAASRTLEKIYQDGAAEALAQIGFVADADSLSQLNEKAAAYAKERGAFLVGKRVQDDGTVIDNPNAKYAIDDSTREMLRGDVATAIEQGLSNDQLAGMIQDSYAFSADRAETVARTETAYADVAGNMASYREASVPKKRWIVGEGCCDECQAMADEVVDMDEPFSSGDDAAPAHPNCRCDVVPEFDD